MATTLNRFNPFAELQALQRQFFGDDWNTPVRQATIPTTDVYTKGGKLTVEAHLPNFDRDAISVDIDDGVLTIAGSRQDSTEDDDKQYIVRESSSVFHRSIRLPEGADTDAITADLNEGVLTVQVPLAEPRSTRKSITIRQSVPKSIEGAEPTAKDAAAQQGAGDEAATES